MIVSYRKIIENDTAEDTQKKRRKSGPKVLLIGRVCEPHKSDFLIRKLQSGKLKMVELNSMRKVHPIRFALRRLFGLLSS